MEIVLLVLISAFIYGILSAMKKGLLKHSRFMKASGGANHVYLTVLLEALISSIGLLAAVLIVYSFTETALPSLITFGLGAFICFFLMKLLFFKMQQKPGNFD